jgi:hypothetical protein
LPPAGVEAFGTFHASARERFFSEPTMTAATRPFPLPSDLNGKSALIPLVRATAAFLRAHVHKTDPEYEFGKMFESRGRGEDREGKMVLRAATGPAITTDANWAGPMAHATVSQTVLDMATVSAAAALVAVGMRLAFDRVATIHAPGRLVDPTDAGTWVLEGAPASVRVQRITAGTTLTPSKLIVLNAASREQIESSNIEEVAHALLIESMALALDSAVFGVQPAGASPAGILNGIAPLSAAGRVGSVQDTAAEDIAALTAALVAVGAGCAPALIMNPKQANALKFVASPKFDLPIWPSNAVAAGTIIMVEPTSFASAFAPTPRFEISSHAMELFDSSQNASIRRRRAALGCCARPGSARFSSPEAPRARKSSCRPQDASCAPFQSLPPRAF